MSGEAGKTGEAAGVTVRTRILDAAADCSLRLGVGEVTVQLVADASGVSRQTIYNHFANRDALILAMLVRETRSWLPECLDALDFSLPSEDLLVQATLIRLHAIERSPYFKKHHLWGTAPHAAQAIDESHELVVVQREYWLPVLTVIQERGDLTPGTELGDVIDWIMYILVLFLARPAKFGTDEARRHYLSTFVAPAFVKHQVAAAVGDAMSAVQERLSRLESEIAGFTSANGNTSSSR